MPTRKTQSGFSLLELLVASSLGLLVILAMASLFKTGMDTTFVITQRAETQQNMRAAIELMSNDIGLAGSGLPSGGLQLSTAGPLSKIACNQGGTCYIPGDKYPPSGGGTPNYMYAIEPGYGNGVEASAVIPNAPGQINSSITSIYCDYNFPLTNFTFTIASATTATAVPISSANQPNNILAPGGLNLGDLLLFTVNVAGNGKSSSGTSLVQNAAVVAEITGTSGTSGSTAGCGPGTCAWTLTFATGDALQFNQTGGTNNLSSVSAAVAAAAAAGSASQTNVCRLNAVSYFLEVPPAGGTVQNPRLMRQVNGQLAVPVADNIINMQFTYDIIDSTTGKVVANQPDPIGAGASQIGRAHV